MKIVNPPNFNYLKEYFGSRVGLEVYPIGVWDMDAIVQIQRPHSVTVANIVHISARILNDTQTGSWDLTVPEIASGINGHMQADATIIYLQRLTGGYFDNINFDSILVNRGYIFIWYIV